MTHDDNASLTNASRGQCCGHDDKPAHVQGGHGHAEARAELDSCCNVCGDGGAGVSLNAPMNVPAGSVLSRIRIAQMDCPTEEDLIRKKLCGMADVQGLQFNLIKRELSVVHRAPALPAIAAAIRDLGLTPEMQASQAGEIAAEGAKPIWPLIAAGTLAVAAEAAHWAGLADWIQAIVSIAAVALCGIGTYRKGWIALRNGNLNINALMSVAVTGALLIGQWPEAAMVMVLFTIAELIEAHSLDRARHAIRGLMQLAPERATVRQGDGRWIEVEAGSIALGSTIRVRPGERIALDGTVVSGRSAVNEAPITGESLPVDKAEGDRVYAGTINQSGSLEYRATAVVANTTLARIIHAVEAAQASRAPTQRWVDRFARVYTPAVFVFALAVAVLPPLLFAVSWLDAVYRALVLLVIACPCALVISTPVTIVSGLTAAARHGILIKGGAYLEGGRKLAWLALDKTGTLTHGRPQLTDFKPGSGMPEAQARQIATSLAARSDHPVSRAVAEAGASMGVSVAEVSDVTALPGRGVQGVLDGVLYRLGNHRLIEEIQICSPDLEARLTAIEQQGKTTLMLTDGKAVLALLAVADTVRGTSREAVAALHAVGVRTLVLTGDNEHTAKAIANTVGIDEVAASLLPEDKADRIAAKRQSGALVGMVGDGINDAPALAKADIGFAMGAAGSDIAIETADVALMDDDLRKVARFVGLSRATHQILVQNIALALGIKAAFLVLTLMGSATMWMAVFADMGTSLLVVANGLRLLRE